MMNDAVKSEGKRPVVSFCIPVYNNAETAEKLVKGILVSDDPRFEVVVVDDASKDNAQEVFSQIHDPRFRFYHNDTNLGQHKNWEHVLELGRGTYLFLCMMRDRLYGEKITDLIEILEQARKENITLLQDGYDNNKFKVYDGMDAMIRFVRVDHPTATIFDGDIFRSIPNRTRYFEISDMYPENYVKRDCLLKGRGAAIISGVYDAHDRRDYFRGSKNSHSTVECGKPLLDMYYAPRRAAVQCFELVDMIECDLAGRFSEDEVNRYFKRQFEFLLSRVSIGWHNTTYGSEYYGQKPRKVTKREMFRNIFDAYSSTEAHLKEKGIFTPSKQKIMESCKKKALFRALRYVPVKGPVKKLFARLGILELYRDVKAVYHRMRLKIRSQKVVNELKNNTK